MVDGEFVGFAAATARGSSADGVAAVRDDGGRRGPAVAVPVGAVLGEAGVELSALGGGVGSGSVAAAEFDAVVSGHEVAGLGVEEESGGGGCEIGCTTEPGSLGFVAEEMSVTTTDFADSLVGGRVEVPVDAVSDGFVGWRRRVIAKQVGGRKSEMEEEVLGVESAG